MVPRGHQRVPKVVGRVLNGTQGAPKGTQGSRWGTQWYSGDTKGYPNKHTPDGATAGTAVVGASVGERAGASVGEGGIGGGVIGGVGAGAGVGGAALAFQNRSTVERPRPPAAYSLPSSAARPRHWRAVDIGGADCQELVLGLNTATVER